MKRIISTAIALAFAFVFSQAAMAQTKTHTESTTKQTGPGPDTKVKTESVTGTVKEYEAGKKIKVTGPANKDYSFDLDENARIDGSIAVGQMARVEFTKSDGKERVVVLSATREGTTTSQPPASRMHMESTTKQTGPGPDTKVKTEVVVGTVKKYEAGNTITVEGPNGKDYSFDLDEQVAVKGAVATGQRVKVEYTKMDNGTEKVLILSPEAKSKKRTSKKAPY